MLVKSMLGLVQEMRRAQGRTDTRFPQPHLPSMTFTPELVPYFLPSYIANNVMTAFQAGVEMRNSLMISYYSMLRCIPAS